MNKKLLLWGLPLVATGAVALALVAGLLPPAAAQKVASVFEKKPAPPKVAAQNHDIAVSVARVRAREFVENLAVSGSLVARDEILIGPEIEGLRVLEILVEEGAQVTRGQVLARLVAATLDAQVAQNEATLARNAASTAQARSVIAEAEARLNEARNAMGRTHNLEEFRPRLGVGLRPARIRLQACRSTARRGAWRAEGQPRPSAPRSKRSAANSIGAARRPK